MEELKDRIIEILSEEYFKDENGVFYKEIYIDRYDELSEENAIKICTSKCPEEKFDDWMMEIYSETEFDIKTNAFDKVWKDEKIQGIISNLNLDDPESDIQFALDDVFYVKYPYDFYLSQPVYVDLIVDTGDGNYDFTLNQPFASWDDRDATTIDKDSSLLWLANQQGYTKDQLTKALRDKNTGDSKFLKSVLQEVQNTSTWMNALSFIFRMTLKEWMELNKKIQKEKPFNNESHPRKGKGRGYLVLKANTPCGLYDPWNGAGSVLEVKLEKEVKLPFRFIDSIMPDGSRGYSVASVYGISRNFWEKNCVKGIHPMKKLQEKKNG